MSFNRARLRDLYGRWLAIEAEADVVSEKSKTLFADARAFGFDGKPLRHAFRLKREYDSDPAATSDQKQQVEELLEALGTTAEVVASARTARESIPAAPASDLKSRVRALVEGARQKAVPA